MQIIYTKKLVRHIIDECYPSGDICTNYKESLKTEKNLREKFEHPLKSAKDVKDRLDAVNAKYITRYKKEDLPKLAEIIFQRLVKRGFVKNPPPNLSPESTKPFAEHIKQVLADSHNRGLKRGYSLVTKFHFFSFPNSFVIFDSLSAYSIQMWAYFAFKDRGEEYENFIYERIADPSGDGYQGVLDFYVNLFKVAPEGMAEVEDWAKKLTKEFDFRITSLDLIDKFLWICEGDPRYLGFLD